jgi:hypothetical protein
MKVAMNGNAVRMAAAHRLCKHERSVRRNAKRIASIVAQHESCAFEATDDSTDLIAVRAAEMTCALRHKYCINS